MEQQQYSLLPEPQEDAHKTLYVIGNGFDLAMVLNQIILIFTNG